VTSEAGSAPAPAPREPLGWPGPTWSGDGALGGRRAVLEPLPGGPVLPARPIAPLPPRIAAFLLDFVGLFFVFVLMTVVMTALGLTELPADPSLANRQPHPGEVQIAFFAAQTLYYLTWNLLGWSPGKRACGLRLVTASGERPGVARALARAVLAVLFSQILLLGYLLALLDPQRRTLHDRVAGTWVVRAEDDANASEALRR
jgi:uncharacterized RDD family membrane protein YckC